MSSRTKPQFDYSLDAGMLSLGNCTIPRYFGDSFFAPLDVVGDAALSSLRIAAREFQRDVGELPLILRLSDMSIELFDQRQPPPTGVWLESDGAEVIIALSGDVGRDEIPDNHEAAREYFSLILGDAIMQHGLKLLSIDIKTRSYFQSGTVRLSYNWKRRTVREAFAVGMTLKKIILSGSGAIDTPSGVVSVLRAGAGPLLLGAKENSWLEAKRRPHDLNVEHQKWELAKDVAALANAEGGLIIFGFATQHKSGTDIISAVRPFKLSMFDTARVRAVLRGRIVPYPGRLEIEKVTIHGSIGIGYLYVPRQPSQLRPFLVRGAATQGQVRSHSITIPMRVGDRTEFEAIEDIHALLAAGRSALS